MTGWMLQAIARLLSLFSKRRLDRELDEELSAHIDLLTADNVRSGMDPETARRQALLRFGSPVTARELQRETRGLAFLESLIQDVRYSVRGIGRNRGFAAAAILTLALGIGGSTAAFSQIDAVFRNVLPTPNSRALQQLSWTSPQRAFAGQAYAAPIWDQRLAEGQTIGGFSYNAYVELRDRTTTFSGLAAWWAGVAGVLEAWGNARIQLVSGNYFQTLGVEAALGRTLTAEDDRPGDPAAVAVISYGLWQRAFGGDLEVLNRDIEIQGTPFRIVGVLSPGLAGLDPAIPRDVLVPLAAFSSVAAVPYDPDSWRLGVFGRLGDRVSAEQARAEIEILLHQAILAHPPDEPYEAPRVHVEGLGQSPVLRNLRQRISTPLFLLMATAGAILLIACANIAGLLLARGRFRQREIAIRLTTGAPRGRIIRQLLTESLVLAAAGGGLGMGIAYALSPLFPSLMGVVAGNMTMEGQVIPFGLDPSPSLRALGFAVILTALAGLAFGLAPAVSGTRADLSAAMKPQRGHARMNRFRLGGRQALVGAQIALALPLLALAGLFMQTFLNLRAVPVGYDPENLLIVRVDPLPDERPVVDELWRRLESLPGVASASVSVWPLFNNAEPTPVCVPGYDPETPQTVDLEFAFPRFFATWGVPVLSGREFLENETAVAVVNEAFARRFFGARSPVGEVIGPRECPGTQRTIVGMVANHIDRQRAELTPMVYVPYPSGGAMQPTTFAVRTIGDPRPLMPDIRQLMADSSLSVASDVAMGAEYRDRTMLQERVFGGFFLLFGLLALGVACLGIYGMLAYAVSRRTAEIGLRMALGARRAQVVGLIVRGALVPVLLGVLGGAAAAVGLGRLLESMFFGIPATDVRTLAVVILIFLSTAAAASFLPAWGASRLDPARTLTRD